MHSFFDKILIYSVQLIVSFMNLIPNLLKTQNDKGHYQTKANNEKDKNKLSGFQNHQRVLDRRCWFEFSQPQLI